MAQTKPNEDERREQDANEDPALRPTPEDTEREQRERTAEPEEVEDEDKGQVANP